MSTTSGRCSERAMGGTNLRLPCEALRFLGATIIHLSPTKEKGNTMMVTWCKVALCFFSVGVLVTAHAQEPLKVDTKGVTAKILYEAPIDGGHLPELKGKYKMRITQITIAPGGHVGDHNHLGPGIRQMTAGEMEYILPDKTMIYRAGDFFFETGDVSHRVNNKTSEPNTHLLFEILPVDLQGASLIVPRDKPSQ
jgi:quercetin dioxygenase-like cupin family protein